jgi:serine/threonine protein kinase
VRFRPLIDALADTSRPIPEHFIWYTLRELSEAFIALYKGPGKCSKPHEPALELPTSDEFLAPSAKPWLSILHLDIKTANVFLEAENADYSGYPKPVLADFGVSKQGTPDAVDGLKPGDPLDSHARFAGTDGWHPPVSLPLDLNSKR